MATLADVTFEALTVLGKHGRAMIVPGEGEVIMYAQTSNVLNENGYFPCFEGGIPQEDADRIVKLAREAGYNLRYDKEYHDGWSDETFTAFILLS